MLSDHVCLFGSVKSKILQHTQLPVSTWYIFKYTVTLSLAIGKKNLIAKLSLRLQKSALKFSFEISLQKVGPWVTKSTDTSDTTDEHCHIIIL